MRLQQAYLGFGRNDYFGYKAIRFRIRKLKKGGIYFTRYEIVEYYTIPTPSLDSSLISKSVSHSLNWKWKHRSIGNWGDEQFFQHIIESVYCFLHCYPSSCIFLKSDMWFNIWMSKLLCSRCFSFESKFSIITFGLSQLGTYILLGLGVISNKI